MRICLVSFAVLLLPRIPEKARPVGTQPANAEPVQTDPRESHIDQRCAELTESGTLSRRESEILAFLARGRSQPYIRDELVFSKNTVATHVKHIYQKLDVHSRQELLDLFE